MRKIYITFSGSVYDEITKKIVTDGPKLGADEVWVYDDVWLTHHDFYKQNKWLWDHPHKRGFGWYAWKPLIILDALSKLDYGDIVLFTDADTYPVRDISVLFNICDKEGLMLFEVTGESNRTWCKRDCFIVMGQDEAKYHDSQAVVARFMLFKKGDWQAYQILSEWLAYCVNPRANTFDPSILGPELKGFKEHRCEQAILGLLAHKYNCRLYREACEIGEISNKDRDLYEQLFSQVNLWNKKNDDIAITAPINGSRYRNVPMPNSLTTINTKYDIPDFSIKKILLKLYGQILLSKNETLLHVRKYIAKHTSHHTKQTGKKLLRKLGYKI
jgi:hypothetical protein